VVHVARKDVKRIAFMFLKERDSSKDLDVDENIKFLQQMFKK